VLLLLLLPPTDAGMLASIRQFIYLS